RPDAVAGQPAADEDDEAVEPGDAVAAEGERLDVELELLPFADWRGHARHRSGTDLPVPRMERQDERPARLLFEVEVLRKVAENLGALADVRPPIGPSVGARVDAGSVQEVVLDELEVRVLAQRLMVDVPLL